MYLSYRLEVRPGLWCERVGLSAVVWVRQGFLVETGVSELVMGVPGLTGVSGGFALELP